MTEQDLNQANVHAAFQHERGETVPERMRTKPLIEAASGSGFLEGRPGAAFGQMRQNPPTGKEPSRTLVRFPDLPQHRQQRFGQRQRPLFVALPDHPTDFAVPSKIRTSEALSARASLMRNPEFSNKPNSIS